MAADPLDALLSTIDALEADDTEDEPDLYPWVDSARWSPAALDWDDPYDNPLPEFTDDGAVIICDPERPWVVLEYQPPWWAE
ncbi:hypothetical protein [Mycobacteroides abscessus]|uniref:hypothetical protein n=1 Tax=Mycobacteroides abscessus TaxID=36809 RepID=UPI0019D2FD6B|nr:hypothetical protein [Mycobacteroides abscessus]MBN7481037.1 hypothetical protein [Mycobacteroides abscessus subsp. massiliense]